MDVIKEGLLYMQQHWLLTATMVFIILVYLHYIVSFSKIKELGLPGPTPWPIVGNAFDFLFMGKQFHEYFGEIVKRYGRVCGMYFLKEPTYLITEPDMLKELLVKKFENFHDRPTGGLEFDEPLQSMMTLLTGQRWKNVRNTLTPTFTSGKLRKMMFIMNEAADILLNKMKEAAEANTAVDIHAWQQCVTMEVILSSAFGLKTDSQTNPNDRLTMLARRAMNPPQWVNMVLMIPIIGKHLAKKMTGTSLGFGWDPLIKVAKNILEKRKNTDESSTQRNDMLDMMLAAQDPDKKGYHLTDNEVIAEMILFILAGYDTSSNILALTCYNLAVFPETQEKVMDEINRVCASPDSVTYDEIQNMPYLEACISETLRLYPPGFLIGRTINNSCVINGVSFQKGMSLFIPIYTLHRDEKYWPNPDTFEPDRFLPENKEAIHPYSYLPFGDGPRNCIGMRFAWMEMKSVLVRMLHKYRLVKGPETKVPIKINVRAVLAPAEPVLIRIEKRE